MEPLPSRWPLFDGWHNAGRFAEIALLESRSVSDIERCMNEALVLLEVKAIEKPFVKSRTIDWLDGRRSSELAGSGSTIICATGLNLERFKVANGLVNVARVGQNVLRQCSLLKSRSREWIWFFD